MVRINQAVKRDSFFVYESGAVAEPMYRMRTIRQLSCFFFAALIGGCATEARIVEANRGTLYQHQWVDVAHPKTGQKLEAIAKLLSGYDAVFFGEVHRHPGVHLAQMALLQAMHELNPDLTLSLEQFERDVQPYLDDYLAGKTGEQYLRDKARAWNNYPTSYRPLVEYAKQHQLPVIAANAPKTAVICVGQKGLGILDAIPEPERSHVARQIDISEGSYRDKYMAFFANNSSHGGRTAGRPSATMQKMAEHSFSAQAVRDDTMAESIAHHLLNNPRRQVVHLNGSFHSEDFLGAVERLARRMPELKIAVINPVQTDSTGFDWTREKLDSGTVLLGVSRLPKDFIQEEHKREWSRMVLKKRINNKCPY